MLNTIGDGGDLTRVKRGILNYFLYCLIGTGMALALQWGYAHKFGTGITRLLHVAHDGSPLTELIARELGQVSYSDNGAHDGIFSYAIARAPLGTAPELQRVKHMGFRSRRVFYSLLAGGGGYFTPQQTLWLLIVFAALGAGFATAAFGLLLEKLHLSPLYTMFVLAHPGMWGSLQILSADTLAAGLSLNALLFFVIGRRKISILLFSLAVLTKEVYWLFPFGISLWLFSQSGVKRQALAYAITPAAPVVLWSLYIELFSPLSSAVSPLGNLSFPGLGLLKTAPSWLHADPWLAAQSLLTVAGMLLAAHTVCCSKSGLLRYLTAPWLAMSLLISDWVWRFGCNSLRGLIPLWILAGLNIALSASSKPRPSEPLLPPESPPSR